MTTLLKKVQRTWSQAFTSKIKLIENYLNAKYEFRYNIIQHKTEMREKKAIEKPFENIDRRKLNTLVCELMANEIEIGANGLMGLLESNFSKAVNPIQEYFKELPEHKTGDYIQELSDTVTVGNSVKWKEYLTKWLVAVIANSMTDNGCQNHACLVLAGEQGKFKDAWLNNLVPKKLSHYLFYGKLDPNNNTSLTLVSEYLFINIEDQLRQLNKKDENELKNLITIPSVKYRRPYDPWITEYPHIASFMASVNGIKYLNDLTGSRRFLSFEVLNIDIKKAKEIEMDKVWAQAYSLFKSGFVYYFNEDENSQLQKENLAFQIGHSIDLVEIIQKHFKVPSQRADATHFYTNAEIIERVEKLTKVKISQKELGEMLLHLGFEHWQKTNNGITTWGYSVIQEETK